MRLTKKWAPPDVSDFEPQGSIIDRLVQERRRVGLTQAVLAPKLGIRQGTLSALENQGQAPRLDTLERYAAALNGHIEVRFISND